MGDFDFASIGGVVPANLVPLLWYAVTAIAVRLVFNPKPVWFAALCVASFAVAVQLQSSGDAMQDIPESCRW
jgi:hypothetical protein